MGAKNPNYSNHQGGFEELGKREGIAVAAGRNRSGAFPSLLCNIVQRYDICDIGIISDIWCRVITGDIRDPVPDADQDRINREAGRPRKC